MYRKYIDTVDTLCPRCGRWTLPSLVLKHGQCGTCTIELIAARKNKRLQLFIGQTIRTKCD